MIVLFALGAYAMGTSRSDFLPPLIFAGWLLGMVFMNWRQRKAALGTHRSPARDHARTDRWLVTFAASLMVATIGVQLDAWID